MSDITPGSVKDRKNVIGGSDVAGILGISTWSTPLSVYLSCTGQSDPTETSELMELGTDMEPVIIDNFERVTGKKVIRSPERICHTEHPWMIAHLDGKVDGENSIVEAKTSWDRDDWGEAGTDQIPVKYATQVQHYLCVSGASVCYVPVKFFGFKRYWFELFVVERNDEIIEQIKEKLLDFWEDHVCLGVPPDPSNPAEAVHAWKVDPDKIAEATPDMLENLKWFAEFSAREKEAKKAKQAYQLQVQKFMTDAELLRYKDKTVASWKGNAKGGRTFRANTKNIEEVLR